MKVRMAIALLLPLLWVDGAWATRIRRLGRIGRLSTRRLLDELSASSSRSVDLSPSGVSSQAMPYGNNFLAGF